MTTPLTPTARKQSPMQRELMRLADQLEITSFRAAAPGLGLGDMRRKSSLTAQKTAVVASTIQPNAFPPAFSPNFQNVPQQIPSTPSQPLQETPAFSKRHPVSEATQAAVNQNLKHKALANTMNQPFFGSEASKTAQLWLRARRLFYIWIVDLTVVATSLAMAFVVASVALNYNHAPTGASINGANGMSWISALRAESLLAPLQWLAEWRAGEITIAFIGVFLIYVLTLRWIAGGTLGQSLVPPTREFPQNKASS